MNIKKVCSTCNKEATGSEKFCEDCGGKIIVAQPPPPPPVPFLAPPIQTYQKTTTPIYNHNNNDYRELDDFNSSMIKIGRFLQTASKITGILLFGICVIFSLGLIATSPILGIGCIIFFGVIIIIIFGTIYYIGKFLPILPQVLKSIRYISDNTAKINALLSEIQIYLQKKNI